MRPAKHNLKVQPGDYESWRGRVSTPGAAEGDPPVPVDLTGWAIKGQIRSKPLPQAGELIGEFDFQIDEAAQADPETRGTYDVELLPEVTALVTSRLFFDWQFTDSLGRPHTYISGGISPHTLQVTE